MKKKNKIIPFNLPVYSGKELKYIDFAIRNKTFSGEGYFSNLCTLWIENKLNIKKVFLTPSCTSSLEMAALLLKINKDDEIIMPSYTFVSTANPFVLRGAKIVFVDIRSDNLNINENLIESAITKKTKAIVVMHYAGISCEMDFIKNISNKYKLWLIEDSAQSMMSKYKNLYLGSLGHIGCFSFHETKNYTSGGEGGAILINDESLIKRASIIKEKGTNRSLFIKGKTNKYVWKDIGSSYTISDIQAAYLWSQLKISEKIQKKREMLWKNYFLSLENIKLFRIPFFNKNCKHNANTFYLIFNDKKTCNLFIEYMKNNKITTLRHYVPLHISPAGKKFGKFHGNDINTIKTSNNLVRLPLFFNLKNKDQKYIISNIYNFIDKYS
ncbi:wecE [Wigglesworthia glossinidia endosymbiont of Glossina brevipalpis]|uniref:WecE protein n=1 Tax=Wigglesworthia glossinidia brevipalpis TaxID=36870 RepID=Q8D2Q2_WIGBR|nr:wecE [Wigglesworthia glossinidia endosymbiont of Glossina brevipalpis]